MFTPRKNLVLVKPDPKEEVSQGGIVLPDGPIRESHRIGTVLAVGKDSALEVGDRIVFGTFAGHPYEDSLILNESPDSLDIMGVVVE
jgi:co-chaperonin GroES (HSP10)